MNIFQLVTIPLLCLLLARSLYKLASRSPRRRHLVVEAAVWLSATVAVLQPDLTMRVANAIGIGRGADLVLYVFVLVVLTVSFYFYRRLQRVESELSEAVRQLAIRDAIARWPGDTTTSDRRESEAERPHPQPMDHSLTGQQTSPGS